MFLSLAARLRDHPLNRTELSRPVRDDCVNADQPVSRNAVSFVIQGLAYVSFPLTTRRRRNLAAAWTANVEELCRLALMEFDAAEKLAFGAGPAADYWTTDSRRKRTTAGPPAVARFRLVTRP